MQTDKNNLYKYTSSNSDIKHQDIFSQFQFWHLINVINNQAILDNLKDKKGFMSIFISYLRCESIPSPLCQIFGVIMF